MEEQKEVSFAKCFLLALNNDLFEFKKNENSDFEYIVSCKDRSVENLIAHLEDSRIPEHFIAFGTIKKYLFYEEIFILKEAIKQKILEKQSDENKKGIDKLIELFGDQILK